MEDERLDSLDALRLALSTAPFFHRQNSSEECNSGQNCIQVSRVSFRYADREERALNSVSLTVEKGGVYGVMGAKGSGKTTLLKLILGRLGPLISGDINVFGSNPQQRPLPVSCVGFMPKEMSLSQELTVGETLHFFGHLCSQPSPLIVERVKQLKKLFNLHLKRQTRYLSRDHCWRLSLAVALVHSPPLLLLDEPTVAVDPLLRQSIWSHLRTLCAREGLTVVFTSDSMEESVNAQTIAFIRSGRVLCEDNPRALFQRFQCKHESYHALYLKLCQIDSNFSFRRNTHFRCESHVFPPSLPMALWPLPTRRLQSEKWIRLDALFAAIHKNIRVLRRNPFFILTLFLFPPLLLSLLSLSNFGLKTRHPEAWNPIAARDSSLMTIHSHAFIQLHWEESGRTFQQLLLPGYITALLFTPLLLFTAFLLIRDQSSGFLSRSLDASQSPKHLLFALHITQSLLLLFQLISLFPLFPPLSRPIPSLALLYLQGQVGISTGLLIAALSPTPFAATLITSGTLIPGVLLTGVTWPIDSIQSAPLRTLLKTLPLTLPIQWLRAPLATDSDLTLALSLLLSVLYTFGNSTLALIIFKWRNQS